MALPGSHVFLLPVQQQKGPLADMDQCQLPSMTEQARKTSRALSHLHSYVERCGGTLAIGWDCKLRFRTTTRRNGRLGLTTDNYYYSPCGKTFRTHRQVADFLGLPEPQPKQQQQQPSSSVSTPGVGTKRILQVTLVAASAPTQQHCSGNACKRVALPASSCDSAATAGATPAAAAVNATPCSAPVASCNAQQQLQVAEQDVQSMPPPPPQPVRRTKAMLAAKYAAASGSFVVSGCCAVSTSTTSSAAAASDMQQQQQHGAATPCLSGTTCSTASGFAATVDNGASRRRSSSACASQLLLAAAQQQISCKPSKPKAVPSWRVNLRELASQIAAAKMASKSTISSSSGKDASTASAGQQ